MLDGELAANQHKIQEQVHLNRFLTLRSGMASFSCQRLGAGFWVIKPRKLVLMLNIATR